MGTKHTKTQTHDEGLDLESDYDESSHMVDIISGTSSFNLINF